MKSKIKRILFLTTIFVLSTTVLSYAGTLVKKVYFSGFEIELDGEDYLSENPILLYQNRTYVPLREFSEMVGIDINFNNGKIYIKTGVNEDKNFKSELNGNNAETESKEEIITEKSEVNIQDDVTVYVSKSGLKYHKNKQCTSKTTYYPITLSKAKEDGYTACLRCYK